MGTSCPRNRTVLGLSVVGLKFGGSDLGVSRKFCLPRTEDINGAESQCQASNMRASSAVR